MIEKDGWFKVRTNGSHHVFKHIQKSGLVVVPHPKKDVPVGTAKSILKQAGIK
jgi:predicted RNA binding protein YcfA (HicA-like mRNA interferase family)